MSFTLHSIANVIVSVNSYLLLIFCGVKVGEATLRTQAQSAAVRKRVALIRVGFRQIAKHTVRNSRTNGVHPFAS